MGKINKVILIGTLGSDLEIVKFENGNYLGKVSMATNYSYVNKGTGEKVEVTEWHNLVFNNKSAEVVQKYAGKGSKMYVEGRLQYDQWVDKHASKRITAKIQVNAFEFLSFKEGGELNKKKDKPSLKVDSEEFPF